MTFKIPVGNREVTIFRVRGVAGVYVEDGTCRKLYSSSEARACAAALVACSEEEERDEVKSSRCTRG